MGFDIDSLRNENLGLKRDLKEVRLALRKVEEPKPCGRCPELMSELTGLKDSQSKAKAELESERAKYRKLETKLRDSIEAKAKAELECRSALMKMQRAESKARELSHQPGPSMELNRLRDENRLLKYKLREAENVDSDQ